MKKWLLAFTLIIFLGMTTGFEASMQPLKRQASPDSPAVFQIEIKNTDEQSENFDIDYEFTKSGWIYFDTSRTIPAGETAKINVTISPDQDAIQQSHSFSMYIQEESSGNSTMLTDYMVVQRQFRLNVKDFSISREVFDPGESVSGSMTIQNLDSSIISNYSINSKFSGLNKTREGIAVAPAGLKTYSFTYDIPEDASPGERNFSVTLNHEGVKQTMFQTIKVNEIRNVTKTYNKSNKVLYETGSRRVSNYGNSNISTTENMSFPTYLDALINFEPEPDSKLEKDSNMVYRWNVNLEPGQTQEIRYRVDYWIPVAISGVILVGIVLLRRFSGSVKITKKVEEVDNKGTLRVSIELENNSEKVQDNLQVRDFVPNVAQLDEDFDMTKPTMKRTTEGIELKWSVDRFKPDEQRVIQYEVSPKVVIENGIELESAELVKNGEVVRKSKRK